LFRTSHIGSPDLAFIYHSERSAGNTIGYGVETGKTLKINIFGEIK
jgi:hypothetical protein